MTRVTRISFALALLVSGQSGVIAQQFADAAFDATVERPAFADRHPVVLVDEAHHNFHTAGGRYFSLQLATHSYLSQDMIPIAS